MYIKRRKDMNNAERTERIITHLRKNKKYRVLAYNIHAVLWGIILLLPVLITMLTLLKMRNVQDLSMWVGGIILCGIIIVLCIFVIYRKTKNNGSCKVLIEANINKEEMMIWMPGGKSLTMGIYHFVAYHVEGERTYRFQCKVKDDQIDLYEVLIRLGKDGVLPKIKVLVNPQNYKDYKMLGYEFIEDALKLNEQLVNEELDEYYDTSEKWKYIK